MGSKDAMREIINSTAELLMSDDGEKNITTRRIAEKAGINPAMVNYYFGSKDNLLKEAISVMNRGRPADMHHGDAGMRKAMFDHLFGMCETAMQYSRFGLGKDPGSFSKDVLEASSKLIEMKRSHTGKDQGREDAAAVFKTVSFLMTASCDPGGFAGYSGIDIRAKSGLRMLVSEQLDILLGESL